MAEDPGSVLGIVVQPKTQRPVFVYQPDRDDSTLQIWSFANDRFRHQGKGHLDTSGRNDYGITAEISGYPRCHMPDGVVERGAGYGTALYTGLVLLAAAESDGRVDISLEVSGAGISSTEDGDHGRSALASRWWRRALELGLVRQVRGEGDEEEVEEEEQDVDLTDLIGHRDMRKLDEVLHEIAGDHGFSISNVRSINVDIMRYETRPAPIDVDVYTLRNAMSANLVALRLFAPGDLDEWLQADPETVDVDDAMREVLVALDLSQTSETVRQRITAYAKLAGATDAEVRDVLLAARYRVMVDIGRGDAHSAKKGGWERGYDAVGRIATPRPPVERLPRSERRDVERALENLTERRSALGWDALADLP